MMRSIGAYAPDGFTGERVAIEAPHAKGPTNYTLLTLCTHAKYRVPIECAIGSNVTFNTAVQDVSVRSSTDRNQPAPKLSGS